MGRDQAWEAAAKLVTHPPEENEPNWDDVENVMESTDFIDDELRAVLTPGEIAQLDQIRSDAIQIAAEGMRNREPPELVTRKCVLRLLSMRDVVDRARARHEKEQRGEP